MFGTLGIHIANRAALIRHHARTTINPIKLVLTSKNTNRAENAGTLLTGSRQYITRRSHDPKILELSAAAWINEPKNQEIAARNVTPTGLQLDKFRIAVVILCVLTG